MIARLELSYTGVAEFMSVAPVVRAKMEARGCKILHAMMQDSEFPEIIAALSRSVLNEMLTLAVDSRYAPRFDRGGLNYTSNRTRMA